MTNGRGTSIVRRAAIAGAIAMLIGGGNALAARNAASNAGKGKSARSKSQKAVGLTADGRLLCFPTNSADRAEVVGAVTGLGSPDSALIGIDFRVQGGGYVYCVVNVGG